MAKPLLTDLGEIRTVLAVVKWNHRRALIHLAEQIPAIERIYAADYEPFNRTTRRSLSRANWRETCPRRVHRETQYLMAMQAEGRDMLQQTSAGWIRTSSGQRGFGSRSSRRLFSRRRLHLEQRLDAGVQVEPFTGLVGSDGLGVRMSEAVDVINFGCLLLGEFADQLMLGANLRAGCGQHVAAGQRERPA